MIRFGVVLLALFSCTAWFGGCVRRVVDPPIVDCGPAQDRYCEAPDMTAGNTLAETEPEDAANRNKWQVCVTDHRVVVDCLKTLQNSGVIKRKDGPR